MAKALPSAILNVSEPRVHVLLTGRLDDELVVLVSLERERELKNVT